MKPIECATQVTVAAAQTVANAEKLVEIFSAIYEKAKELEDRDKPKGQNLQR